MEIDESKFGRRKHHRGHWVTSAWVFGVVERTPEWRVILFHIDFRNRETLEEKIIQYIASGSIIYSDGWAAYNRLSHLGYQHEVVNHSLEFVRADGVHTNTIEGRIKRKLY